MEDQVKRVISKFKSLYDSEPIIVRSPARINLIGEHTDYNNGFVLPASINREMILAIAPRSDEFCKIHALDMDDEIEFKIASLDRSDKNWANYIIGVIEQFRSFEHEISGFECVFGGNIAIGAGLSSSASLEGAFAFALNRLNKLELKDQDLIEVGLLVETDYMGVKCGIMDQFINFMGKEDHAIMLDCLTLKHEYIPLKLDGIKIVLCDTQFKRELATTEYNTRRHQCDLAVRILKQHDSQINSLRDVTFELLESLKDQLNTIAYKRCDFVVRENERVKAAASDLKKGDFTSLGKHMYESHEGLRYYYEVSSNDLDLLVDFTMDIPGVLGARMMGAGFGGCTINLVKEAFYEEFQNRIQMDYIKQTGRHLKLYDCSITNGTSLVLQN